MSWALPLTLSPPWQCPPRPWPPGLPTPLLRLLNVRHIVSAATVPYSPHRAFPPGQETGASPLPESSFSPSTSSQTPSVCAWGSLSFLDTCFFKFGKISAVISSCMFSVLFLPPFWTPVTHISGCLEMSYSLLVLFPLKIIFFFFFPVSFWIVILLLCLQAH